MNNSVTNTARLLGAGLRALLVLTLVTGVIYPLAVTGIAQALFHDKANGSEIKADGKVVGSSLIGSTGLRAWTTSRPRPANGLGENSVNTQYKLILSGATNRSADNAELIKWVKDAKAKVVKDNSTAAYKVKPSQVPADAVTSSGSGLDPDISPQYADIQVHRVAEQQRPVRRPGAEAGRRPHRRPHARLHGRAARQRPRTQHRAQGTRGEELMGTGDPNGSWRPPDGRRRPVPSGPADSPRRDAGPAQRPAGTTGRAHADDQGAGGGGRPAARTGPRDQHAGARSPQPAGRPVAPYGSSAASVKVCPSRSGVRCVLSVCRPEVLVLDVLGLSAGAARVRAGRRDGANLD